MEYNVLGSIEIDDQGRRLRLSGPRQRALLAILLLHANEVVSTDRLIEDLWEHDRPSDGRSALAMQLSRLRKKLHGSGETILHTREGGYLLRIDPDALDAQRFERLLELGSRLLAAGEPGEAARTLERALALWRGRPYEELAYESFAQGEIARLEERKLVLHEACIDAQFALGRHAFVVGELEALVSRHPLRERLREQLMLALYRTGRQAESLAVYHTARRLLVDELGIEPGPCLRELEQAILRQDSALDPRPVKSIHVRRGHGAWPCSRRPRARANVRRVVRTR